MSQKLRGVLPDILQFLLTKTISNSARLAVLIGHVIGVALRLKPVKERDDKAAPTNGREIITGKQVRFCEILSSIS